MLALLLQKRLEWLLVVAYKKGVWFSPSIAVANKSGDTDNAGYKYTSIGGTIGFDTAISDKSTIGIALSVINTDVKYNSFKKDDKTNLDTYLLSVYGAQRFNNIYLRGVGSIGISNIKNTTNRLINHGESAIGKYNAKNVSAEGIVGYVYKCRNSVLVTPEVGLSYMYNGNKAYTESGTSSSSFSVSKNNSSNLELVAGLSVTSNINYKGHSITPEVHGRVRHEFSNKIPM